jgi:two-component system chemotaxis response regulator CheB
VLEKGRVRVTRGPKENRFRPAVDPLFRSAAYAYGPRVVGIILSGALGDGTAGLLAVKKFGGIAVVQDPQDAKVPSMPERALEMVSVDHRVPVAQMGELLLKLVNEEVPPPASVSEADIAMTELEIAVALQRDKKYDILRHGSLSPLTCPECQGVLVSIIEGNFARFRCHTGHAFSADSLLEGITESVEEKIWAAIRSIQESIFLLNHMGDHFAEINQPKVAAMYFREAKAAEEKERALRQIVFSKDPSQLQAVHGAG